MAANGTHYRNEDSYHQGRDDLLRDMAWADDCCPTNRPCVAGTLCLECWRGFLVECGVLNPPLGERVLDAETLSEYGLDENGEEK